MVGRGAAASPAGGPGAELTSAVETPLARALPVVSDFTGAPWQAERLAWRLLLLATVLFLGVVLGGWYAVRWYIGNAIVINQGFGQRIEGVGFIQRADHAEWVELPEIYILDEGDTVRTSAGSRVFMRLFDFSTVLLYPDTTLQVAQLRRGRFGPVDRTVVLRLESGRVHVGVAPDEPPYETLQGSFEVQTPSGLVGLQDGSYSLEVTTDESTVLVRVGKAIAHAAGASLTVGTSQRVRIPTGAAPVGPLPIPRDVLKNGSLQDGVPGPAGQPGRPSHWTVLDLSEREPPGQVSWEIEAGQGKVSFERVGEGHGETIIRQSVGRDLSDTASVLLSAEVRVDTHSLSGGGFAGTEYPLMLRVVYEDINRTNTVWVHGFLIHNRDDLPVRAATQVRAGEWSSYEVNLLQLVPRPAHIERLEVLAAGWSYRSAVRNVRLVID